MSNISKYARRFDSYLMDIRANELKRMAGLWVKAGKLCKAECAAAVREGLADPQRVPAALAKLKPPQRVALGFIKEAGGDLTPDCLEAAMVAAGHRPPGRQAYSRRSYPWCEDLISRGVALAAGGYDPMSLDSYSSAEKRIFTDERLLEHAPEPEIVVIEIDADLPAEVGLQRPPGSVVLDIVGVVQAVEKAGGVGVTQAGLPRVSDMKKLRREMRWTDSMKVDGLPFPNLTEAVVTALRAAGLLEEPPGRFAARSRAEQVRPLVRGFTNARGWTESGWHGKDRDSWRHDGYPRARHALLTALRALPATQPGFFAMDRFDKALFERIGEHVSLDSHAPSPPHTYGVSGDELQSKMEEWRRDLRSRWLDRERPWIESAFTTWLYWLGIVELSIEDGAVRGFRLTELGREVLHGAPPVRPSRKRETGSPEAWVVQPDLALMVYIDKASPTQLAFAERIAERQGQAQRHVAHYVLTRDSIYRALESGCTVNGLLDELRKGAKRELPANIEAEIRGWSERREQIVLRRHATLLEFGSEFERRAAITGGIKGTEVSDRFLLVESAKGKAAAPLRKIETRAVAKLDYAEPLPPCVEARETGKLRLTTLHPDLLIHGQLDGWGERIGDDAWDLSEKSVRAAVQRGRSADELVDLLDSRAAKSVPPFLQLALGAWADASLNVQLARVAVLRCPQPDVFHAIAGAKRHKGCLLGRLGPDTFLVDTQKLNKLKKALRWAGIEIEAEITPRKA